MWSFPTLHDCCDVFSRSIEWNDSMMVMVYPYTGGKQGVLLLAGATSRGCCGYTVLQCFPGPGSYASLALIYTHIHTRAHTLHGPSFSMGTLEWKWMHLISSVFSCWCTNTQKPPSRFCLNSRFKSFHLPVEHAFNSISFYFLWISDITCGARFKIQKK